MAKLREGDEEILTNQNQDQPANQEPEPENKPEKKNDSQDEKDENKTKKTKEGVNILEETKQFFANNPKLKKVAV